MSNLLKDASILLTPTAYDNGSMNATKPENGDGDFTFSRAGNASRVNSSGNIVTESANTPRIDYTDGCGVWLLEPQSTNYSSNSEQPSTWHSNTGVTITANATTSPEGIQNSSLVVNDASSGGRYVRNLFTFSSGSGLQTVTTSYFIKYYNNQWVRLRSNFFIGSPANNASTWFDIQNGVVGTVDANHTAKIEDYSNGWYRCSITFDIDKSVDTNGYTHIEAIDGDNSNTWAANGQGFYAYGSQGEDLSYATSYIPTNGAISTRLQDIANNSGNSTLINSTEGVLYAEIAALANDGGNRIIALSDGSQSQRTIIFFTSTSNEVRALCNKGSTQCDISFTVSNVLEDLKVAFKFKQSDFALWINGVEVATETSGFPSIGLNELAFDNGSNGANFFGKVKAVAVFKEALTDAQLQCLTTI